jgi:hypothetical protein
MRVAPPAVPSPASGTAWNPAPVLCVPDVLRSAFDRLGDGFDSLVGLDRAGPKPITLPGVNDSSFTSMEAKVQDLEKGAPPMDARTRQRLDHGEVVSSWRPAANGAIEELTQGVANVPLETFLSRLPAKDWGKNLSDWKGGDVQQSGPGRQVERMVMRMPGKDLDMTKVETIGDIKDEKGKLQGARVRWEVLKSDNGTVVTDVGTLRFERFGDKTLITWQSAHKLDKFPLVTALAPKMASDAATGAILTDFFVRQVEQYRTVTGG